MRFVTTRELRLKPAVVWKAVEKEHEIVITSKGKPVAILTAVKEDTLEEELDSIRTTRAVKALDSIHRRSVLQKTDTLTEAVIENEIVAVRKNRKH